MAVKNYTINDKWIDIDKQNIVELQSVDGVIDSIKINGEESGGGGNDFIITLSYNESTKMWEPDCTYEEALDAYNSGKNFTTKVEDTEIASKIFYSQNDGYFIYTVLEPFESFNPTYYFGIDAIVYSWKYGGITTSSPVRYYMTDYATAVPDDVIAGKTFFNANGLQVGTI